MKFHAEIKAVDKITKLTRSLEQRLSRVVLKTAFSIERDAKLKAPVDTGALRSSIYVVSENANTQENAYSQARARRSKVKLFEPIQTVSIDKLSAIVAVGVEYGALVEYGIHRKSAKPYLIPAVNANRRSFQDEVAKVLKV